MYEDDPCVLASNILWYLEKEKDILQNADLTDQVWRFNYVIETKHNTVE